jgi:hypothetical protein
MRKPRDSTNLLSLRSPPPAEVPEIGGANSAEPFDLVDVQHAELMKSAQVCVKVLRWPLMNETQPAERADSKRVTHSGCRTDDMEFFVIEAPFQRPPCFGGGTRQVHRAARTRRRQMMAHLETEPVVVVPDHFEAPPFDTQSFEGIAHECLGSVRG